jgi:hypothetical protein
MVMKRIFGAKERTADSQRLKSKVMTFLKIGRVDRACTERHTQTGRVILERQSSELVLRRPEKRSRDTSALR